MRSGGTGGSGSGIVDGHTVGLQVGDRWTDGTGSTENAVIVDVRLTKLGVLASHTHQCFGTWTGRVGAVAVDGLFGWAEGVHQRWCCRPAIAGLDRTAAVTPSVKNGSQTRGKLGPPRLSKTGRTALRCVVTVLPPCRLAESLPMYTL
jgi:hypothetical protein